MSFLSDETIKHFLSAAVPEVDRIVIAPRVKDFQIGQCSIDLRLSAHILRFKHPFFRRYSKVFNSSSASNSKIYETGTIETAGFIIKPNELIIGRTIEIVKLPKNKFGLITGRSSFSRLGLEVQLTQDLKQPGHNGVVLLQIKNNSPFPIRLFPEMRIAQLMIGELDNACKIGYDDSPNSKYANEVDGLVSMWQMDKELQDKHVIVSAINFDNLLNLFLTISLIASIGFFLKSQFHTITFDPWNIVTLAVFGITLLLRIIIYIKRK